MATKSIFKNVKMKNQYLSHSFISALENASGKQAQPVTLQRPVRDVHGAEIKKLFGERREK